MNFMVDLNFQPFSDALSLGVIGTIAIFIYQQLKDRKEKKEESNERLERICNTLLVDINELEVWINSKDYELLKTKHYQDEYHQNIYGISSYVSIINSGLITYLQEDTIKTLNWYYFFARLHNKRMHYLVEIANNRLSDVKEFESTEKVKEMTESKAWRINENQLTIYENEMKRLIPEVKKLLNEELQRIKD